MTAFIPLHSDNTTEKLSSQVAEQRGVNFETLILQFVQQGIGLKNKLI